MGGNFCKNDTRDEAETIYEEPNSAEIRKVSALEFISSRKSSKLFDNVKQKACYLRDLEYITENEHWYNHGSDDRGACLFDLELFVGSFENYMKSQERLKNEHDYESDPIWTAPVVCSKNESLLQQYKERIRKGIPYDYFRKIILKIFDRIGSYNNSEYNVVMNTVFEARMPVNFKNCPLFSEFDKLEDLLNLTLLNDRGILALKRISCILNETLSGLEYNPKIVRVLSLLLIFLSEGEAYFVVKQMLTRSKTLLDSIKKIPTISIRELRWHLSFNSQEYLMCCKIFYEAGKIGSPIFAQVDNHLREIGVSLYEITQSWFTSLFLGNFPLKFVLKLFLIYLNEGVKIYFRISIALIEHFKTNFLECKCLEDVQKTLNRSSRALDPNTITSLIRKSLELDLGKFSIQLKSITINPQECKITKEYFRPNTTAPSLIMDYEQFESLWNILPKYQKMNQGELFWSTARDGFSLHQIYVRANEYKDRSMLVIVESDRNRIFGFFVDTVFDLDATSYFIGSNHSFVFTFYPQLTKYECPTDFGTHLYCNTEYFSMGDDDEGKAALVINDDLSLGYSQTCETYHNAPLHGDSPSRRFNCLNLEIFMLGGL